MLPRSFAQAGAAARLSRRAFLGGVAGASVLGLSAPAHAALPRVVSLDYALAETLIAIGLPPIGLADVPGWSDWVVEPKLPADTIDVGLDLDPNLELLTALKPDLILTTDYVARTEPALGRIAAVKRVTIYAEGQAPLESATAAMRTLGATLGAKAEAERYLEETDTFFAAMRARVQKLSPPPVLLVNFMDARHVRVYGGPGLFQGALDRIGVENAWDTPTNFWGFSTIGIEDLGFLGEARLVAFEPLPADALQRLSRSPIWTALPFVRKQMISRLPPVLTFGGVPSARRFAELLVAELEAA